MIDERDTPNSFGSFSPRNTKRMCSHAQRVHTASRLGLPDAKQSLHRVRCRLRVARKRFNESSLRVESERIRAEMRDMV